MVPAGSGSIFSVPPDSLSTRSAVNFRWSKIVSDAGQLAWIFRTTGAWAWARDIACSAAIAAIVAAPTTMRVARMKVRRLVMDVPPLDDRGGASSPDGRNGRNV